MQSTWGSKSNLTKTDHAFVDIVGVTGSIPVAPTIPPWQFHFGEDAQGQLAQGLTSIPPDSRPIDARLEIFGTFWRPVKVQGEHPNDIPELQAHDGNGGLAK
jgi:hypothetical protein